MTQQELQLILQEGEGYRIEFKESLNNSISKELVAFANASGGRIFLGIDDKNNICGVKISNELKSKVQDYANNCDPPVNIKLEESQNILILNVKEGAEKPYRCTSGFYIRVGPNSQKLTTKQIVDFLQEEGRVKFDELLNKKADFDTYYDPRLFEKYLQLAGISKVMDDKNILENLGVVEIHKGKPTFNNTGVLFFCKNPSIIHLHAIITCALFKGTERINIIDRKDFEEDIITNIDNAIKFLKQHLQLRYEYEGTPQRKEIPEIPYDALREAIINAAAHRDYFEKGARVMFEIFDDRVVITNPGGLVKGLTKENFGKISILRNPNIASLLHRATYIEQMGTGIKKMNQLMLNAGLKEPEYKFDAFFTITFKRPFAKSGTISGTISGAISGTIKNKLSEKMLTILKTISEHDNVNILLLENKLNIPRRSMLRDIKKLKDLDIIAYTGSRKTGKYIFTDHGNKIIQELLKDI